MKWLDVDMNQASSRSRLCWNLMVIAYEFIRLSKDVAQIKANLCVLCDNEQYELSESQLQSRNDK